MKRGHSSESDECSNDSPLYKTLHSSSPSSSIVNSNNSQSPSSTQDLYNILDDLSLPSIPPTSYNFFDNLFLPPPNKLDEPSTTYYNFEDPFLAYPKPYKFNESPASPSLSDHSSNHFDELPPLSSTASADTFQTSHEDQHLDFNYKIIDEAFKCRIKTIRIFPKDYHHIDIFLIEVQEFIFREIKIILANYKTLKVFFRLEAFFSRNDELKIFNLKADTFLITPATDINEELDRAFAKICLEEEIMIEKGSGWNFVEICHLDLCLNECDVLNAGSYIPLPKFLADKHAIINIVNYDFYCFKWSILAHKYPISIKNNPNLIRHYIKYKDSLNFNNISFPVSIKDIPKFEKLNNISVNVFSYNANTHKIYPLYYNCKERLADVVDLLFLKKNDKSHYALIKNLSRLLSSQINKHKAAHFFCRNCLNHFSTTEILTRHEKLCLLHKCTNIELPYKFPFQKFKEYEKSFKNSFVCYSDFECILKPSTLKGKTQEHILSSFAYFIKNSYGKPEIFRIYRAKNESVNVADIFITWLYKDAQNIYNEYLDEPTPIKMTADDEIKFKQATKCFTCEKAFTNDKVKDHDHISGFYRAALCNSCNLRCKKPSYLPIFLHNGSHYDFKLLIKSMDQCIGNIKVIPQNDECYISIIKDVKVGMNKKFSLKFLDSFHFLPYSLDTLVKSLKLDQFKNTTQYFHDVRPELVLRKGIFPFSYISDFKKYVLKMSFDSSLKHDPNMPIMAQLFY